METIEEKLKYIGLDLNNIPEFLKQFKPLDFRPSKLSEDNNHIVYKYVPIDRIQILITPKNRLENLDDKYTKAAPISAYLEPKNENDIEKHTKFLSMLKQVKIGDIEKALEEQKKLNKKIPFTVKFYKSYAWQVYYSEFSEQYFMMVPSEDADYDNLFLLLKMQIEFNKSKNKKAPRMFVPINCMDYSETILKKSEIKDIENYLWLFTKNWANIYEVYDLENNVSLQIDGETLVYENIKSMYKIKLTSKEEAIAFYQHIKALFIMQTELFAHYKFKTKVNSKNELEFYYNNTKVKYEDLSKFIEKEYINLQKKDAIQEKEIKQLKEELKKLNTIAKEKELEYLDKQKQIASYLTCKKTFFGKVKFFLKRKNKTNKDVTINKIQNINDVETEDSVSPNTNVNNELLANIDLPSKPYYTIEDLVTLYYSADKTTKEISNAKLDIEAIKNKITNLELKIKNASLYIEEIDKHKKSIFEFWKFANKDELQALEVGSSEQDKNKKHIRKIFRYEFDFDEFSIQMDKLEKIRLSKEEQDSAYIATTDLLNVINNTDLVEKSLDTLKKEQENAVATYNFQEFDIFGNVQDNRAKTKNLGNQKHRENKKDKLKILGITKNMTTEEYSNKIENIKNNLKESLKKIKSKYDMSIFAVADSDELLKNEYGKYYINLEDALKNINADSKEIQVYKLNIKEDMPLICCTNIIFYDNFNKTLPEGMNEEKVILIRNEMYEFEKINKEEFNTNMYFANESVENPVAKKVIVYEYDMKLKI